MTKFEQTIAEAYATRGPAIELGKGLLAGALAPGALVRLPLATMNRHGLIAGATGTGKTKTMQMIAEQLSPAGVPVFVADVKGDVSGLAPPGVNEGLAARLERPQEPHPAPRPPARRTRERAEPEPASAGGPEEIGTFLRSRQGQKLQREVVRGVFGLLRKRF